MKLIDSIKEIREVITTKGIGLYVKIDEVYYRKFSNYPFTAQKLDHTRNINKLLQRFEERVLYSFIGDPSYDESIYTDIYKEEEIAALIDKA